MEVSIAGGDEPEGAHDEATTRLLVTSNRKGVKRRFLKRRIAVFKERPLWKDHIHRDTARRGDRPLW
jgi:hypothetical protein